MSATQRGGGRAADKHHDVHGSHHHGCRSCLASNSRTRSAVRAVPVQMHDQILAQLKTLESKQLRVRANAWLAKIREPVRRLPAAYTCVVARVSATAHFIALQHVVADHQPGLEAQPQPACAAPARAAGVRRARGAVRHAAARRRAGHSAAVDGLPVRLHQSSHGMPFCRASRHRSNGMRCLALAGSSRPRVAPTARRCTSPKCCWARSSVPAAARAGERPLAAHRCPWPAAGRGPCTGAPARSGQDQLGDRTPSDQTQPRNENGDRAGTPTAQRAATCLRLRWAGAPRRGRARRAAARARRRQRTPGTCGGCVGSWRACAARRGPWSSGCRSPRARWRARCVAPLRTAPHAYTAFCCARCDSCSRIPLPQRMPCSGTAEVEEGLSMGGCAACCWPACVHVVPAAAGAGRAAAAGGQRRRDGGPVSRHAARRGAGAARRGKGAPGRSHLQVCGQATGVLCFTWRGCSVQEPFAAVALGDGWERGCGARVCRFEERRTQWQASEARERAAQEEEALVLSGR